MTQSLLDLLSEIHSYDSNLYSRLFDEIEDMEDSNSCNGCKYFMSNHSFRLGHSDYLNGCRVLITPSTFYCNEFESK